MSRSVLSIALIIFAINTLSAQEKDKPASPSTPEAAIDLFAKAWMSKDPDSRFDYLIPEIRDQRWARSKQQQAHDIVEKALREKFPAVEPDLPPEIQKDDVVLPGRLSKIELGFKVQLDAKTALIESRCHFVAKLPKAEEDIRTVETRWFRALLVNDIWKLQEITFDPEGPLRDEPRTKEPAPAKNKDPQAVPKHVVKELIRRFDYELRTISPDGITAADKLKEADRRLGIAKAIAADVKGGKYDDRYAAFEDYFFQICAPSGLTREDLKKSLQPMKFEPNDSEERRLLIAKRNASVSWFEVLAERSRVGKDDPRVLFEAADALTEANLELAGTDDDRLRSLRVRVLHYRQLEEITQKHCDAGTRGPHELARVQVKRFAAELALVRFQKKMK